MGLAAAAVAVCVVNVLVALAMHKTYDVEARRILAGLDSGPVRVLELTLMPDLEPEVAQTIRDFWRGRTRDVDTDRQRSYVSASDLEDIRIEGGTMRVEVDSGSGYAAGRMRMSIMSASLETIVIRETGRPDEVIELRPASVPETESEPESAPDTDTDTDTVAAPEPDTAPQPKVEP